MKTFSINTFGCKVNQYETQQIHQLLEQLGLIAAKTPLEKPDLVIINTCCVTRSASAKSRQYIHKAQKLYPNATIVVCGCLPAVQLDELNNQGKNVHLIRYRETTALGLSRIVKGLGSNTDIHRFLTCRDIENSTIKTKNGNQFCNIQTTRTSPINIF